MKKITLALLCFLSVACGRIQGYHVNTIIEYCKDKGGIHEIWSDLDEAGAHCSDGSFIHTNDLKKAS